MGVGKALVNDIKGSTELLDLRNASQLGNQREERACEVLNRGTVI
jgi:hypothetical protein